LVHIHDFGADAANRNCRFIGFRNARERWTVIAVSRWHLLDLNSQFQRFAVANHARISRFADAQFVDDSLKCLAILDTLASESGEYVAARDSGFGSGRTVVGARNDNAAFLLDAESLRQVFVDEVLHHHAEIAAVHGAVLEELLRNALGQVAGNGKADTLETARAALDGRGDADHFAVEANERPAAVAGIDRRARLQEIVLMSVAIVH